MSFHGGLMGIILSAWFLSRRFKHSFWLITDLVAVLIGFILGMGRIANFVNGELAGRVTTVPWAVVFPSLYDHQPRHPSQIYQSLTEGFFIFFLLWFFRYKLRILGWHSAAFLILYGSIRFMVEFFREPDVQLGLFFSFFTAGQLLCLLMLLGGVVVYIFYVRRHLSITCEDK